MAQYYGHKENQKTLPPKKIDFHRCISCNEPIRWEDWLGVFIGTAFQARGYVCPKCKTIVRSTTSQREKLFPFNWRKISSVTTGYRETRYGSGGSDV